MGNTRHGCQRHLKLVAPEPIQETEELGLLIFEESDFHMAVCVGPLQDALKRVAEAANQKFQEWVKAKNLM